MSNRTTRRQAEAIIERMDAEAQDILRHTRIDLAVFLAQRPEEKAARWRLFDRSTKEDVVIQELRRNGIEWTPELLALHIAKLDARWGIQPASDLAIPPAAQIADAAAEQAETARRHGDHAGAGQLDRVRLNVLSGVRMAWHQGKLLIASLNTPGAVYAVSRRGCSCPNGRAGKSTCWHVALFDLLLDMQAQRAVLADEAADADAGGDEGPEPTVIRLRLTPPTACAQALGRRLAAARACYLVAA